MLSPERISGGAWLTPTPLRLRDDFDRAAREYDSHARLQNEVADRLAERLRATLDPSPLIVDIGAGTGALAQRLSGHRVVQLDVAPAMCRAAARLGPALCADALQLPFADQSLPVIASNLCLQWLPLEISLAEWQRVLRPGGRLIASLLGTGSLCELATAYRRADLVPRLLELPNGKRLARAVDAAGLRIDEIAVDEHRLAYPSAPAFLRHFRRIGADYKGSLPRLSPAELRRLIAAYPASGDGVVASYRVLTVIASRD